MEDRSFEKAPLYPVTGRKSPAQKVHFNRDGPTFLWMTVCAKDRREWIAQDQVQTALHKIWLEQACAWLVGDYLLMPDHLHFFCAPCELTISVENWIAFWKSQFTKSHQEGSWEWQRKSFHHRIRSAEEFHEKWIYMMENPLRKIWSNGWKIGNGKAKSIPSSGRDALPRVPFIHQSIQFG